MRKFLVVILLWPMVATLLGLHDLDWMLIVAGSYGFACGRPHD